MNEKTFLKELAGNLIFATKCMAGLALYIALFLCGIEALMWAFSLSELASSSILMIVSMLATVVWSTYASRALEAKYSKRSAERDAKHEADMAQLDSDREEIMASNERNVAKIKESYDLLKNQEKSGDDHVSPMH